MMNILIYIAILSIICQCKAFLPSANTAGSGGSGISKNNMQSSTLYAGIDEWREESLQSKYTLDSYNNSPISSTPGVVPILPFPFSGEYLCFFVHIICTILCNYSLVPSLDLLLQGQRTQLNLYEDRFHKLFQDAMDNHSGSKYALCFLCISYA